MDRSRQAGFATKKMHGTTVYAWLRGKGKPYETNIDRTRELSRWDKNSKAAFIGEGWNGEAHGRPLAPTGMG